MFIYSKKYSKKAAELSTKSVEGIFLYQASYMENYSYIENIIILYREYLVKVNFA